MNWIRLSVSVLGLCEARQKNTSGLANNGKCRKDIVGQKESCLVKNTVVSFTGNLVANFYQMNTWTNLLTVARKSKVSLLPFEADQIKVVHHAVSVSKARVVDQVSSASVHSAE